MQGRIERDADHVLRLEVGQGLQRTVVVHDRNAFEAALTHGDGVQQAAVVGAVARIGAHQQGVLHAVARHHLQKVAGIAHFLPGGAVAHIVRIRKSLGVEHMTV